MIMSTCQQISQSPVNTSTAKQLFSFPKAERFPKIKKNLNDKIAYDLPGVRAVRSAAFGYGNRYDFGGKSKSPPPTAYTLPTDFVSDTHSKAFSFGISREAYNKVYLKEHPARDKTIPGPGTYNPTKSFGDEAVKFSLRPKTTNPLMESTTKLYPGPGAYENKLTISPKGQYYMSKFKSSCATTFNPPKSERFKDFTDKYTKQFPGPGYYAPKEGLNENGEYFVSKYKSSNCRTFSHCDRNALRATTSNFVPGPGSYRLPSDFGYYESKHHNTATEPLPNARESVKSSPMMTRNASAATIMPSRAHAILSNSGTPTGIVKPKPTVASKMSKSSSQPDLQEKPVETKKNTKAPEEKKLPIKGNESITHNESVQEELEHN